MHYFEKVPRGRWHCPDHKSPTKNKRKTDSGDGNSQGPSKKSVKKTKSEMAWCEKLLEDLMKHEDAWPFLEPVNTRQFPTYKKVSIISRVPIRTARYLICKTLTAQIQYQYYKLCHSDYR